MNDDDPESHASDSHAPDGFDHSDGIGNPDGIGKPDGSGPPEPPLADRGTEVINPFQPPAGPVELTRRHFHRPNLFDWMFALFLASVATVTVFPTTCIGGALVLSAVNSLDIVVAPQFGMVAILALLVTCAGLALAAAVWVARWYIDAVKTAQARKTNAVLRSGPSKPEPPKLR